MQSRVSWRAKRYATNGPDRDTGRIAQLLPLTLHSSWENVINNEIYVRLFRQHIPSDDRNRLFIESIFRPGPPHLSSTDWDTPSTDDVP